MRLGLYYDLRNPGGARSWARVYAATLDRIGWADRAGIGAIWVTEHHGFADGYLAVRELAPVLAEEGEL
jgi:hypothetical protein